MRWHLKPQHHAVFCMAKIYLIRHAESLANTRAIYQGQSYDTGLSSLGVKQAQALKKRFANQNFTAIFTSPLKRTIQTASLITSHYHLEPNLIETNHGLWEGKSKAEIASSDLYKLWLQKPGDVQFPGGEHFSETVSRSLKWFNDLSQRPGIYAAITHSNIIMALLCHLNNQPLDNMWQYAMQPTAVTLIETHSPAKIIYTNDISHLKGLKSNLTKQAI